MSESRVGLTPLHKGVIVDIYDDGSIPLALGGFELLMLDDSMLSNSVFTGRDGKTPHKGNRHRWAIVLGVSDEAEQAGLKIGDKVLCERNEWTPHFEFGSDRRKLWWINHEKIIGVDDAGLTKVEKKFIKQRNKQNGWS